MHVKEYAKYKAMEDGELIGLPSDEFWRLVRAGHDRDFTRHLMVVAAVREEGLEVALAEAKKPKDKRLDEMSDMEIKERIFSADDFPDFARWLSEKMAYNTAVSSGEQRLAVLLEVAAENCDFWYSRTHQ